MKKKKDEFDQALDDLIKAGRVERKVKNGEALFRLAPAAGKRFVAVACALCDEKFPLKKKGDLGSYNLAAYDRHLIEIHNIVRPKPVPVEGH